jgi:hypothetical protein
MKKFKTLALDLALGMGLLVATGLAAGVLPGSVPGADVFGGSSTPACAYLTDITCYGNNSGCRPTVCNCGNNPTHYNVFGSVDSYDPCGVAACGQVGVEGPVCAGT